jgi:hypothetical protein
MLEPKILKQLETTEREDRVRSWESVRLEISEGGSVVACDCDIVSLLESPFVAASGYSILDTITVRGPDRSDPLAL